MSFPVCYLLRRDVEGDRPQVDLLVGVDAGHDEEQTWKQKKYLLKYFYLRRISQVLEL